MATKLITNPGEELNKAILNKVDKVLSNMDSPYAVKINIEAEVGCSPIIGYEIKERIIVKDNEDK